MSAMGRKWTFTKGCGPSAFEACKWGQRNLVRVVSRLGQLRRLLGVGPPLFSELLLYGGANSEVIQIARPVGG